MNRRTALAAAAAVISFGMPVRAFAAAEADLLIAFDNSFTDGVGGDENAKVVTAGSVAASNAINDASGTGARMRICGYHKTTGQGGRSSLGGFASWMWNYGDGNLDDVTAAADANGADLVAFICAPAAGEGSAAVAYQPGRYAAYGTGNFWNNIVAHESGGHNYGCDHRAGRENPKTIMMHNYCGGGSQGLFSSPNLWLNGARLRGEGSCLGAAVQGGDAAYVISAGAQGKADSYERVVYGSDIGSVTRRWQFNKPAAAAPAGTVIADEKVGAQAVVRGHGATFTGSGLRLPGGTTGNVAADSIAAYLDLPNGLFSSMPNFTIEIWATPLSAQNWMRILEIGRTVEAGDGLGAAGEFTGTAGTAAPGGTSGSDEILLSAAIGTNLGAQRLMTMIDGGSTQIADSNLGTTAGQMHHYAVTFADTAGGGVVSWYRDGALIKTITVAFHSAQLEDVNNWLGRSLWSGDAMSHIDYHDVRIHSTALNEGRVAGNYRMGPHDAKATLWANDAWGNSGFVSGPWEFGAAPVATRDYETGTMLLRTPRNANNVTFPGKSLNITGGNLHLNATGPRTTTINDLRLNGGTVGSFGDGNSIQTLAGQITVKSFTDNAIRGGWGPMVISANITGGVGGGGIFYTESAVTLTGNNTGYLGATIVGDGRFGTLRISNETNLGGNPTFFGGAWLQLNRGILETTQSMTIDDPNRGVRIGPSGGFLNAWQGTTLTIVTPVSSPAAGNTLQTAPMDSNPIVGVLFVNGGGTVELTSPNNSHNGEMEIGWGELKISGAGRINNGDHWMPITLNGLFTYNSTAAQTLRGVISGNGGLVKNNTGTLNINGSNTFSGSVTVNAGTLYANPGNAATNRAFSYVNAITVNNGGTLRAGSNGLFGWDGTQEKPITVNAGGTLSANGGAASDVGVGLVTLNGGILATLAAGAGDWGSWRFDNATDKLLVTENSTVSAQNVKFGDASAAIEVASGKVLNFTGTITNATNGGISYLRKKGAGTLTLAGANTFTGATTVEAGTLHVTGSIGAGSAATIAAGAILSGTGTVNGALTLAENAIHAPGNPTGSQTVGGVLSYGPGARVKWMLTNNSAAASAQNRVAANVVNVAAGAMVDVSLNAAGSTVSFLDAFWMSNQSWPVVTSNSLTGSFSLGTISADSAGRAYLEYGSFTLSQGASGASLQWKPKPFHKWRGNTLGAVAGNEAVAGFFADADSDRIINAWEYYAGTDPLKVSVTSLQTTVVEGRATVTFQRNLDAADVRAAVQGADAITGPWQDMALSIGGTPFAPNVPGVTVTETGSGLFRSVQFTDAYLLSDPGHTQRYFRLSITPQ